MCHVSSEGGGGGAKATSRSRSAVSRVRPRWPRVCFAASATSRSRRFSQGLPRGRDPIGVCGRRSSASVPRTTNPARARPDIRRVRSEFARDHPRADLGAGIRPRRPAARRMRRTLYCDGERPAAAVPHWSVQPPPCGLDQRDQHLFFERSRIAMAAAGVGTCMGE